MVKVHGYMQQCQQLIVTSLKSQTDLIITVYTCTLQWSKTTCRGCGK